MDAAHFVLAPFLGDLWSFARIFIGSPSGRQRFNVLAALNAMSHERICVTNDRYINAESVCEFLQKIGALGLTIPITCVLDNARDQKGKLGMEVAASLDIALLYLPPSSPNLNRIERLWQFTKKKCLYSISYDNFPDFKAALQNCLAQTPTTYKTALATLLTLNFQTFSKTQKYA